MTDFYSVLQRAVAQLPDGSGPQRRAVYDKARKALLKQLQSFDPPLPSADVTAQRLALEDAIRKIENEIARQIRTRRAVQGAVPGATGARTGAPAAKPAPPPEDVDAPAEPPLDLPHAREEREEREELLESAVSDATLGAAEPAEPPAPVQRLIASREPEPLVEDEPHPLEDADMFERDVEEDVPPRTRRRGRRAEPAFDDAPDFDAPERPHEDRDPPALDYEDVTHDVPEEDEEEPVPARPRRRPAGRRGASRRELKAERSAARAERKQMRRTARRERGGRSIVSRIALPLVVLALLAGASYAAYTQREALMAVIDGLDGGAEQQGRQPVTASGPAPVEKAEDRLPSASSTVEGEDTRTVQTIPVRPGGEGGTRTVGEDVSPFASDPEQTPAEDRVAAADPGASAEPRAERPADVTPSGTQSAVLYEEAAQAGEPGAAVPGTVEWAMVRQSVGGSDPEPVVRANATVPDRGMNATITIRENRDSGLPASHLIEIAFEVPESFEGGGVKNVPGIIMKQAEQSRGEPLRGAAARVSSGLFWIALSEDPNDRQRNLQLLAERDWIDVPILYESGRRAILTLRKGSDGFESVDAAIRAWSPG